MESLFGNPEAKEVLKRLLINRPSGHALLFTGPRGVGKSQFAQTFAQQLLGEHRADLHLFCPQGRAALHSIDSMRYIAQAIHLPPTQAPCKIFIINEAERLPSVSANALLKTFEEPPADTLIVLISSAPDQLLPTIRSRCRQLPFKLVAQEEIAQYLQQRHGMPNKEAIKFARQARGSIARAAHLATQGDDLLQARLLHLLASAPLPDYYHLHQGAQEIAEALETMRKEALTDARRIAKEELKELSATAREQWEKELEGATSRLFFDEIDCLLETIALWYRDAFLCNQYQDTALLTFPEHAAHFGSPLPLDQVQQGLTRCRTALSRFSKPAHCLASLFLHLELLFTDCIEVS